MKWNFGFWLVFSMLLTFAASYETGARAGQQPLPAVYEPTEIEKLRLEVKQKDAQLAQQQFQYAQAALAKAISDFRAEGAVIAKAHDWPADIEVDPNTLIFTLKPAPTPAPKMNTNPDLSKPTGPPVEPAKKPS